MHWIESERRRSQETLREFPERSFDAGAGVVGAPSAASLRRPANRGCPVCREVDSVGHLWHSWYVAEGHDDPRSRQRIAVAGGLCGAHLRGLCADPQARWVLPQMLADVIAYQLTGFEAAPAPAVDCEACARTAEAEQKVIGEVVVRLGGPEAGSEIRDADYCLRHLFWLMAAASPPWNTEVGAMTRQTLLDTDSGGDLLALLISFDSRRSRTAPLWVLVDDLLTERVAHDASASTEERVVADLGRDCCPVCRAAAHAELGYVNWLLAQDLSRLGSVEFWLCSTHLAAATLFGYAAAQQIAESMRGNALAGLSEPLGGSEGRIAVFPRRGSTVVRRADGDGRVRLSGRRSRFDSDTTFDVFRGRMPVCAACAAGSLATEDEVSQLLAALEAPRIRELWGSAHGPCLRHVGLFGSDRLPRQVLHDRLEPLLWELLRNPFGASRAPNGSGVLPWQRAVPLVCGEALLGCTAQEYQQYVVDR